MYCGQRAASLNPRHRIACSAPAPVLLESEIHSLDHTSHNGTRKSAYLLLHVSAFLQQKQAQSYLVCISNTFDIIFSIFFQVLF
jgi:hypothetical protein